MQPENIEEQAPCRGYDTCAISCRLRLPSAMMFLMSVATIVCADFPHFAQGGNYIPASLRRATTIAQMLCWLLSRVSLL